MNEWHGDEDEIDARILQAAWDKAEEEADYLNDFDWFEEDL